MRSVGISGYDDRRTFPIEGLAGATYGSAAGVVADRWAFASTTAKYGKAIAPTTKSQRHGDGVMTASTKQTIRIDIIHAYRTIRLSRSSDRPGCALVTEMTVASLRSWRFDIYPPHQEQRYAALIAPAQPGWEECEMTDRTYRVTEIVGTSKEGLNQAITNGIARAGETLRHLDWFEVTDIRGHVADNQIDHYQVTMKVGFRLEDS